MKVPGEFAEQLPPGTEAPALARRALERELPEEIGERIGATLRLLVSELVTNSIRHGIAEDDDVRLEVSVRKSAVRVTVRDNGAGFDVTERKPRGADGGFGLFLVEKMASRWGIEADGPTCVWFEIDLPAAVEV